MHVITVQRRQPVWFPEYDCILDNEHCPFCKALRDKPGETLVPVGYHGRHGGTLVLAVFAELANRKLIGLSLEVHGIRYHKSVADKVPELVSTPRGALLAIHHESDLITPETTTDCIALSDGRPCNQEVWGFLIAEDMYRRFGVVTIDSSVDLTAQPDELWVELERLLALQVNGAARESA